MDSLDKREAVAWEQHKLAASELAEARTEAHSTASDLSPAFVNWLAAKPGLDGMPIGYAKVAEILTPKTSDENFQIKDLAASFLREQVMPHWRTTEVDVPSRGGYEAAAGRLETEGEHRIDDRHEDGSEALRSRAGNKGVLSPEEFERKYDDLKGSVQGELDARREGREFKGAVIGGDLAEEKVSIDKHVDKPVGQHVKDRVVEGVDAVKRGVKDKAEEAAEFVEKKADEVWESLNRNPYSSTKNPEVFPQKGWGGDKR